MMQCGTDMKKYCTAKSRGVKGSADRLQYLQHLSTLQIPAAYYNTLQCYGE